MVGMQVGIEDAGQGAALQRGFQQGHRLRRMAGVARVHHAGAVGLGVQKDHLVGRQPVALQHLQVQGAEDRGHGADQRSLRSSRRRILPTLLLGRSSRNSMILGRL